LCGAFKEVHFIMHRSVHELRCAVLLCLLGLPLVAGCANQLMPSPTIVVHAKEDPFRHVPDHLRNNKAEVLYATDRTPDLKDGKLVNYGIGRSKSLAFGVAEITIGKDLSWESLVEQSRKRHRTVSLPVEMTRLTEIVRYPEANAHLKVEDGKLVDDTEAFAGDRQADEVIRATISARLAQLPRKHLFIFVHGVGSDFDYTCGVMAGMWHFAGRGGVPIIYSWPAGYSKGLLQSYTRDRESSEFTIFHFKQFLRAVVSCPEMEKLHLVAHSRGTDVLVSALRELNIELRAAGRDARSYLKLGNVILLAADLDLELASQRIAAERVLTMPEQFTVYASQRDRALAASDVLFASSQRVGQMSEASITEKQRKLLAASTMEIIDCRVSADPFGHSYYRESPAVSSDLILLLRDGAAPGSSQRPLQSIGHHFWRITDDYLQRAD